MIKPARERLVRAMRGDATVFKLVGGRIYPQDVATIINPVYPCIAFRIDSGTPDPNVSKVGTPRVIINCYSTKSYNESYSIYEAVKDLLSISRFYDVNVNLIIKEESLPREFYDPVGQTYNLITRWSMMIIEV